MSSRKHRLDEVVTLIRAYEGDPEADNIITMKTGYSKAFIAGIRSDIESVRLHEDEA